MVLYRGRLRLRLLKIILAKVVQKRSDHRDRSQLADVLPARGDDASDDVRCQLELEAEEQPDTEPPPDRLTFAVSRPGPQRDTHDADERLERAERDNQHRRDLDDELEEARDSTEQ